MKRGEIFYIDTKDMGDKGHEQRGTRPAVIIQNDIGNKNSKTLIVAMITSREIEILLPTHVRVYKRGGLKKDSVILTEQIRTIDKSRLQNKIAQLTPSEIEELNRALRISVAV